MLALRLGLLVVLLAVSAFFSSSETALFSLRSLQLQRLRSQSSRAARAILQLLEQPRSLLATILIGNTVVNVVISVLAGGAFVSWFGAERGPLLATLVTTLVLLVFGEIAPKTLAVGAPAGLARWVAPSLLAIMRGLRPLTHIAVRWTDALSAELERRVPPHDEAMTEEEIKMLVTMGSEQGIVGTREKDFIHNVFHLNDRRVSDIVTRRARVFLLDADVRIDSIRDAAHLAGFTRIPVYSGSKEDIVGYVEASDLLWGSNTEDTRVVREVMRPLHFYPASKRAGELLSEMQRDRVEIAGVVDEHGTFDGVVSLEDAIEQVVGEIFDLHDLDRFRFTSLPEGEVLVAAQMELDVFNRLLGVQLDDEDAETIGGYLINRLGRIPQIGETYDGDGLRLEVDQAAPHRILKLRAKRVATTARKASAKSARSQRGR